MYLLRFPQSASCVRYVRDNVQCIFQQWERSIRWAFLLFRGCRQCVPILKLAFWSLSSPFYLIQNKKPSLSWTFQVERKSKCAPTISFPPPPPVLPPFDVGRKTRHAVRAGTPEGDQRRAFCRLCLRLRWRFFGILGARMGIPPALQR